MTNRPDMPDFRAIRRSVDTGNFPSPTWDDKQARHRAPEPPPPAPQPTPATPQHFVVCLVALSLLGFGCGLVMGAILRAGTLQLGAIAVVGGVMLLLFGVLRR